MEETRRKVAWIADGDVVVLEREIFAAPDVFALSELQEALRAHDMVGFQQLGASAKIAPLSAGTYILQISRSDAVTPHTKVRVMSGPLYGIALVMPAALLDLNARPLAADELLPPAPKNKP